MKQTAVEWLIERHFGSIENCSPNFRNHIEQAKEMEKEQIMDAFNDGINDECIGGNKSPQQYYNETYKSE
jgi:hypothetical protein